MLKIALIAAAASKSKNASIRHAAEDSAEGLAIMLLVFVGLLAAVIFLVSPIVGIIGGVKLITGETEAAYALMVDGALGGFLNMVIALYLGSSTIEDNFFPYPRYYRYEDAEVVEMKLKNREGRRWLSIGCWSVVGVIAGMIALGVVNVAAHPVFAGVLFIVLFFLSMVFIIAGALVKFFFG